MAWSIFLSAVGLLFVFEGALPFVLPNFWRQVMQLMFVQSDRALRVMGLVSMLLGLILVCVAHDLYPDLM